MTFDTLTPVGVIGSGAMGSGIASVAAMAGHPVQLFDVDASQTRSARVKIVATWRKRLAAGKVSSERVAAAESNLDIAAELSDLAGAGLVIEAVTENLEVKQSLLAQVEEIVADKCVIASNTSSISITAIASGLREPSRFLGLHFFNPVPAMRLVEVVNGLRTDGTLAETMVELMNRWGKSAVICASAPGFIVNHVARPFYGEAFAMQAERIAPPEAIDALLRDAAGFKMGPFELTDLIGQDVNAAANRAVWAALGHDPRFKPSPFQVELVAAKMLGRKTGRGVYDHAAPVPAPTVVTPSSVVPPIFVPLEISDPVLSRLVQRLRDAAIGMETDALLDADTIAVGDALVAVADGRTAASRSAHAEMVEVVLLDAVALHEDAALMGVTSSVGCGSANVMGVAAAFARAGTELVPLADIPGLVVIRTVGQLINIAIDVVAQGIANAADVAIAMQLGTNYPHDLFEWGQAIGAPRLVELLDNLSAEYRDTRHRVTPLLRQFAQLGRSLSQID